MAKTKKKKKLVTLKFTREQLETLMLVVEDMRPKDFNEYFPDGGRGWEGEGCQLVCDLSNTISEQYKQIKENENGKKKR